MHLAVPIALPGAGFPSRGHDGSSSGEESVPRRRGKRRNSDDEGTTPPPTAKQPKGVKRRNDVAVLEMQAAPSKFAALAAEAQAKADTAALKSLPQAYAEDYFNADARVSSDSAVYAAACAAGDVTKSNPFQWGSRAGDFARWLSAMKSGFSVLVEGIGSKRRLLHAFAVEQLEPWGATTVRMDGYDCRFSLCDCFRGVLDQLFPSSSRSGVGVDALAATIAASRTARPLVFLVHNLECLPPAHQATLAMLSKAPHVYLVASVDSIWAPLMWSPGTLRNACFWHEEANTFETYEAEAISRYPGGMPAWAKPHAGRAQAQTLRLGLILRSLTANHGELVAAMAEHQLEASGKKGITLSALLDITTDKMIANNTVKLKRLLMELRDHEVVVEKSAPDGSKLFKLSCEEHVLQKLAKGEPADGDAGGAPA